MAYGQTVEQLIQAAQNYRIRSQPKWVQELVYDLAQKMKNEHLNAEVLRGRADTAIEKARELLAEGPADSDTFMDLPNNLSSYSGDEVQRPLGKGANIEFRHPDLEPGEGIDAKWENGGLLIHGLNHLSVIPIDRTSVKIVETSELS